MQGYFNGQYYLGSFTQEQAGAVLNLVDNVKKVEDLRHSIYDLSEEEVDRLKEAAKQYEDERGTMAGFVPPPVEKRLGRLQDYQTKGVAFMYLSQRCLLGDETGMGKTVQIAGLVNFLKQVYAKEGRTFRYLFLGEKAGVQQLADKLMKFTNEYVGTMESSEKRNVAKYLRGNKDARHYSLVAGHAALENPDFIIDCAKRPFDMLVFDESAKLKNRKTQMYIAAQAIFPKHAFVIELNATPLEVDVWDFYNQLQLLDKDYLPNIGQFQREFCEFEYGQGVLNRTLKGYKNEVQFKRAVKLRYLARTRKEEGAAYEDNKSLVVYIPLSKEQKMLHGKTTLHQLVDDYPPDVNHNVEFSLSTTPKAGALLWLLRGIDVKQERAIIYCNFKHCQEKLRELLEHEGYSVAVLNGDTGKKVRDETIVRFNKKGLDILITNVQRCLDLRNCANSFYYTLDKNPQKMVQFEGRIIRDFDVRGKRIFMLVAEGREKRYMDEVLRVRAEASTSFAQTGQSMALEAVKGKGIKYVKYNPLWLENGVRLADVSQAVTDE